MARVVLNRAAIDALAKDRGVLNGLERVGEQVAERARSAAPKRTGAGAASIGVTMTADAKGPVARVGWDAAHFYMRFQELGTSKMSARPFLRPALDGSFSV